jgi:excisionase family DNA binding protein
VTSPDLAHWLISHARQDAEAGRPLPPGFGDLVRGILDPYTSSHTGTKIAAPATVDLSVEQMAEHMGCSPRYVRRLCQQGKLTARRTGRRSWTITVQEQPHGQDDRAPDPDPR